MFNREFKRKMALGHSLFERGLYRRAANAFSEAACTYFCDDETSETFTEWREAVRMQRKALSKAETMRKEWITKTFANGRFLDPECPLAGRCEVGGSGFAIR
ncbi:hypothetical protein ACJVQT_22970 [Enterobacter huaxiensis]|uniref:hypothetical protein n=1 Tax=Enterobacter huaxiensis TaxID=2494702 RepID=UPI002175BFB3|nr:hypothetical protein [Enterobacter huaxiensis]MCS5452530.1 hypothetical protein [Enterobacter huaxiensis]